jgi:isopentenyl diphosphate isomerase/L-lactate dehydrogenase-like FMN-dependent dehydrogenase
MARKLHSVDHFRTAAKARLPKFVFDYVDGGAGSESAVRRNVSALDEVRLTPRILNDCTTRNTACELFGHAYAAPFGVAPIGFQNLIWPGADLALAKAAAEMNLLYVLSTAGTAALETIAGLAPDNSWFQLYIGGDDEVAYDLVARANAAGYPVLVVTVDVPIGSKRIRDLVNGFIQPFSPQLRMGWQLASHPRWSLATLQAGVPRFANMERYIAPGTSTSGAASRVGRLSGGRLDWTMLKAIREKWPRKLVLKGIMHAGDARRAADAGVDGVIVSNHGGRQWAGVPGTIEVLPEVRQAVGRSCAVLFDGGIRSGDDICKAIALGADFVLLGRAAMYGVGAMGAEGGPRTLRMIWDELDNAMAQLGCRTIAELAALEAHPPRAAA